MATIQKIEDQEILNTLDSKDKNKQTMAPEPDVIDQSTVDPNLTVEKRMEGLLSSDSPYLTAARTRAKQAANVRGLLNTSMAAGAGEKAAIETALPIAQQDAKYFQESAGKTQTGRVQEGLYETQGEISKDIATHEGEIASGLSAQKAEETKALSTQEATQRAELSLQESLQTQDLEQIVQAGANYRQQMELNVQNAIATMELGTEERTAYANSVAEMGENFMLELNNIQRDPNVTSAAKTGAIKSLRDAYYSNLESLASIYRVSIHWQEL